MAVDEQSFKNVLSRWATGITIITTAQDENWQGFTANSFATVSVNPPLVSMNVAKRLDAANVIRITGYFAVNILALEQMDLGKIFAGIIYKENRFAGIDTTLSEHGCPILPGVMGWLECKVYHSLDVDDNIMFVGEVLNAGWAEGRQDPLLYFHRHWGKFTAIDPRDE